MPSLVYDLKISWFIARRRVVIHVNKSGGGAMGALVVGRRVVYAVGLGVSIRGGTSIGRSVGCDFGNV